MRILKEASGFILFFVVMALVTLAASSCTTTAPREVKSCEELVAVTATELVTAGYSFVHQQQEAVGELAAFQKDATVRLLYLTPIALVSDALQSKGWTPVDQCRSPKGETVYMLTNTFEIPLQPGPKASL